VTTCPSLAYAERVVSATLSPALPILRALRISGWLDSYNDAAAEAERLRCIKVDYCERLLRELHERFDGGDATASILGDLLRQYRNQLLPKEEIMLAATLAGAGMAVGTTLVWQTGKLAALPEMRDNAFTAIKAVYGDTAPDPFDTDRVEYLKALGLEAGRFWTSIRSGFPRKTLEDIFTE
jgi:hypothetical protein